MDFWSELRAMRKRLPCVEVFAEPSSKVLFFEKEVVGLRLFDDLFDGGLCLWSVSVGISRDAQVITGKEADEVYLHNVHVLSEKLISKHNSLSDKKQEGKEKNESSKKHCTA